MEGHGEKLSRKQEQAIAALLSEPTLKDAADKIDIGETTLWRWLQMDEFDRRYKEARRQVVIQAIAQLQQATGEAVEALREVMNDIESPASTRVSAARTILDIALKAVEVEDLAARIEEIEDFMRGDTNQVAQ